MLKLVTNTDAADEKGKLKFICVKDNPMPRFKRNKQSQLLISTITLFSTILLHVLSVEIKQRKVANLESKQSRNWAVLSQVTEGQVILKQPFFSITPSGRHKWLNTANSELNLLEKMAVFAVKVATAEGPASIIFQKKVYLYKTDQGK